MDTDITSVRKENLKINANKKSIMKEFSVNRISYSMAIPGIIYLLIFCYLPMIFIFIAFKKYNVNDGFFGSPWAGFDNFKFFFSSAAKVWQTTYNTIVLNLWFIITGLILQIGLAILINEVKNKYFKVISQSLFFLPYFLSWVVIGAIVNAIFTGSVYGPANEILKFFGIQPIVWYLHPEYWRAILIGANIWKWTGFGSLVYMAAIAGFDTSYYEAAIIDGASRFQCIRFITIPMLIPTATIMVLFAIGRILFGDFGMVYNIVRDIGPLLQTTEVIDTYVYRSMRTMGNFSIPVAIGMYQSFLGLIIIVLSNKLAKKVNDGNSLF